MLIDLTSELTKKILHHRNDLNIKSLHKIAKALGVDPTLVAATLRQYRASENPPATKQANDAITITKHSAEFVIKKGPMPQSQRLNPKLTPFPFDKMEVDEYFDLISETEFNRCNRAVQQLRSNGYDRMFRVSLKHMKCWRIR